MNRLPNLNEIEISFFEYTTEIGFSRMILQEQHRLEPRILDIITNLAHDYQGHMETTLKPEDSDVIVVESVRGTLALKTSPLRFTGQGGEYE